MFFRCICRLCSPVWLWSNLIVAPCAINNTSADNTGIVAYHRSRRENMIIMSPQCECKTMLNREPLWRSADCWIDDGVLVFAFKTISRPASAIVHYGHVYKKRCVCEARPTAYTTRPHRVRNATVPQCARVSPSATALRSGGPVRMDVKYADLPYHVQATT